MRSLKFLLFLEIISINLLINLSLSKEFKRIPSLHLNSSIHDLRFLNDDDCKPFIDPPKPSCMKTIVVTPIKMPVFTIIWRLDDHTDTIPGFCYHAVNIT